MIYNNQIHNFEDFNARFGYKRNEKGDILFNKSGAAQRKNNIIYQYYKESFLYYRRQLFSLKAAFDCASKYNDNKTIFNEMLSQVFDSNPEETCPIRNFGNYVIQSNGVCIDGDINSVRYKNSGHIYKMKIGKYVNKYLDDPYTPKPFWIKNSTLRIFFIEEITELWKNKRLKESVFHIVVDDDFEKTYSTSYRLSDQSNFNSCMDDRENYNFYCDHSNIFKTIRLEDDKGNVYARAILTTCFSKKDDTEHVLLERIYMNKRCYADLLFEKAKQEHLFTIYKNLNASCHESQKINFVSNDKQIPFIIYIPISLCTDDYLSYQDTFKWYYPNDNRAYNASIGGVYQCLDVTSLYYDEE